LADKATPTGFPFGFASGHAFGSLSFGRSKESEHWVLSFSSLRKKVRWVFLLFPQKAVNFLLSVQKKVNIRFTTAFPVKSSKL